MPDLQTFGEDAHGGHLMSLESLDLQQHEILLRLHAGGAGGDFANPEEASDLIAQIGKCSIVEPRGGGP